MKLSKVVGIALILALPGVACIEALDNSIKPLKRATLTDDWRDEVVYQLLVDRFANGDVNNDYQVVSGALARYQGGDWRGIINHFDYLTALGVTTIWISPVVRNVETDADVDAYHGYWSQDLTQTNPHFGDLATLRLLVKRAHESGIKVLLDVVANHMGQVFFYDMNMNGKPDEYIAGTGTISPVTRTTEWDPDFDPRGIQAQTSLGVAGRAPIIFINDPLINRIPPRPAIFASAAAYHAFGRVLSYDDPKQVLLADFPGGLKDLATELPQVRTALIDAYVQWVKLVDFDGFRLDTVKHVEHDFWRVFSKGVRDRLAAEGKTNFMLVGEAFDGDDALLGSYTRPGELDSVFYFSQHFQVFRDVFEYANDPTKRRGTDQIASLWSTKKGNYGTAPQPGGIGLPPYKALMNIIENHDRPRFLFESNGNLAALRNALTLLMTEEGIPCIYYGSEQEFSGGNDPANREVLWKTAFSTEGGTFRHIARLAKIRQQYIALRRGDTTVRWSSAHVGTESDAGIFAFERGGGDVGNQKVLVVMNVSESQQSATERPGLGLTTAFAPGTILVDVLSETPRQVTVDRGGELHMQLPPQSAAILVPQNQVM